MTPRKYEVVYSSLAHDDLRDIYQHIAHVLKVPNVAKRQVERIEKAVRGLSQFPMRHEAVDWEPWHSMGIRRLRADNCLAFIVHRKSEALSRWCACYMREWISERWRGATQAKGDEYGAR
jgi:plasmid stabilization system protein ParE